jgi:hypothetical protein
MVSRVIVKDMNTIPTVLQLGQIDDSALKARALESRMRAARGDVDAFGLAHVLEVEQRQRSRARILIQQPLSITHAKPRAWWKTSARSS